MGSEGEGMGFGGGNGLWGRERAFVAYKFMSMCSEEYYQLIRIHDYDDYDYNWINQDKSG